MRSIISTAGKRLYLEYFGSGQEGYNRTNLGCQRDVQNKPALCLRERPEAKKWARSIFLTSQREAGPASQGLSLTNKGKRRAVAKGGAAWLGEPSLNREHVRVPSPSSRLLGERSLASLLSAHMFSKVPPPTQILNIETRAYKMVF